MHAIEEIYIPDYTSN